MHKEPSQSWINQRGPWLLLLAAGGIMGITVLKQGWPYLAALFGFSLLLLWPVQIALGSFAFLVPFDFSSTLGSGKGVTLTFVAGCVALVVLLGFGMAFRRLEFPARPTLYWLLFVLWAAASCLWAYDEQAALQRLPTMLSLFLFYLVATCFRMTAKEFSGIVTLTILGGCAAAVVSCAEFYSGVSLHGLRSSLIIGSQTTDPNIFAAGLLLPFSLAMGGFLAAPSLLRKALMLLGSGIMALAMFLTLSRGALVAIAVMLFVYLRKLGMRWRVLVPTLVLVSVFIAAATPLLQRMRESLPSAGAGRLYIWQTGFAAFKDFGVAGAGLSNFPAVYDKYAGHADEFAGLSRDPHNIYLETGVELGTVGLVLLLMALISQLRMAKRAQSSLKGIQASLQAIACRAAAWGMLTASFFLGMLWFKAFWLVWIMLTLASSERIPEPVHHPWHDPLVESSIALHR